MESRATLSGFESYLGLLPVTASYLTVPCLSFLIYKMGRKIEPTSEGRCEDSIINISEGRITTPFLRTSTRGDTTVTNRRIAKNHQNNQVGGGGGRQ